MGAGNCPETPRQRMIGMMYLVLTAMLALNVSKEVLHAFNTVNESIAVTNTNFESKVESVYAIINKGYMANKEKMQETYDKAQLAKKYSMETIDYINNLKYNLLMVCEGIDLETAKKIDKNTLLIKKLDEYTAPTDFFISSSDGYKGRAHELKLKLEAYKKSMLDLLAPKDRMHIKMGLDTEGPFYDANGREQTWEIYQFYHTIIIADLTLLNKLISEVLNAEYDIASTLYSSVSEDDYKFDSIGAKIIAPSNYILLGDNYEADIFVAAYDSKSKISATINGHEYTGANGLVKYQVPSGSEGLHTVQGSINVPTIFGTKSYPFKTEYIVARPTSAVTLEKMNVFYTGVDNPIAIAASGVDVNNLKLSITNGSITSQGGGKYIVRVDRPGTTNISVAASVGNKTQNMGTFAYRIKRIPDPIALVNGLDESDNSAEVSTLANAGGLRAYMKDFDFAVTPQIKSYTVQTIKGGDLSPVLKSNGARFSGEITSLLKQVRRGQKVFFDEIQVQMPDGTTRTLKSFAISVK